MQPLRFSKLPVVKRVEVEFKRFSNFFDGNGQSLLLNDKWRGDHLLNPPLTLGESPAANP